MQSMQRRLKDWTNTFPRQCWVLFGGTLVNATGSGMVFPFLTLYLNQQLNLSMTSVGVIMAFWSISGIAGQLVGGALTDRFGRKWLMVLSLGTSAAVLMAFGWATSLWLATVVVVAKAFFNSLYQPARDAMIADLVAAPRRLQSYSLLRVISNLGVAIGPAIGGFLASRSYMVTFTVSGLATFAYFLVTLFGMHETKPDDRSVDPAARAGSLSLLSLVPDWRFLAFCAALILGKLLAGQMMAVLPVYMKSEFGLGEIYYAWVMTTNGGMVVLLQYPITRAVEKLPRLPLMAGGVLLYTVGVASVWFATDMSHFILAMVVHTFGEMILAPTATAVTADLAQPHLRGRYMGMLGLTWSMGYGIGPIVSGLIMDQVSSRAVWPITACAGIVSALIFLSLARLTTARPLQVVPPEGTR